MIATVDAVELSRDLIRCPSITPADAGALDVLQAALEGIGFVCHRLKFSDTDTPDIDNLYARFGDTAPNFCFAGHTDVVPLGNPDSWSVDPFGAEIIDDVLYGRGATDMKCAVGAFVDAASRAIGAGTVKGSISLLITGDEEGPAVNGTTKVLDWMAANGEVIDVCLVGEPTNPLKLGEMIKIGRRGSMTGRLTVTGVQGHTAYPHLADNPLPRLIAIPPKSSKVSRPHAVAPLVEAGQVSFARKAESLVEELLAFSPRGSVDDQVNAFCQWVLRIERQFWRG